MSSALSIFAPARMEPRRRESELVTGFFAENLAGLEHRLGDECTELARAFPALAEVLGRAVGTRGRGGARWRPLLTHAAAEACGAARGCALDVAIAVELTHTASLVLDDLPCMDDSATRRGQPATHRLVGSAGAILISVGLLGRAVELLGREPHVGGMLSCAWGRMVGLSGMAGGQAMDVSRRGPLRGAERRLHRAKSSALPGFALWAGAATARASERSQEALAAFGRGLGWAYQILDDVADVGEDASQGHAPGAMPCASLSARIVRAAQRRLHGLSELNEDGLEILSSLAARVVAIDEGGLRAGSMEA